MKIATVVPYKVFPAITGGEKGIFLFYKNLSKLAEIVCFTVEENSVIQQENFTVLPVLGSMKNKLRYINPLLFFKIKNECKQREIRHIIIEHPYFGWLGFLLKKFTGLRLIIHSHNIESLRFKSMNKWWWQVLYAYEKFVHQNADFNFFKTQEDLDFAVEKFGLEKEKTTVITFGIDRNESPTIAEKTAKKADLCKALNVDGNTKLILFNGALNYKPNTDALDKILNNINPILQKELTNYRIVICGMNLPKAYNELKIYQNENVIYKGFVDDISIYFDACDVFINPIIDGGGIKTKLVEALSSSTRSVSFVSGAFGVPQSSVDEHLTIVADNDFIVFTKAVIKQSEAPKQIITPKFFEHFYWGNVVRKAIHFALKN